MNGCNWKHLLYLRTLTFINHTAVNDALVYFLHKELKARAARAGNGAVEEERKITVAKGKGK